MSTTLEQGVPDIAGPDLSSGNIPLPNDYSMRTPADDVSRGRIQSWNVAVERRIQYDLSVDVAYVGTHGTAGSPTWTSTPRRRPAAASTASRSSSISDARSRLNCGDRDEVELPLPAGRDQSAVQERAVAEGRLHASKAKNETDDDGWDGLQLERAEPVRTATTRWPATTGRTSSRWRSSTSCRTRRPTRQGRGAPHPRRLAGQRHLQCVFGHAVHGHGERR